MPIKFSRHKLLAWLGSDAALAIDKEANLMKNIPLKASTLQKIKTGHYVPSVRTGNAIMLFLKNN